MVLNGMQSVYDTDLFMPIMQRAAELAGVRYGADAKTDYSLRVIGDHSRAVTFLVGDGVLPSNEGRGYILRRVLRRAVRHGHFLGMTRALPDQDRRRGDRPHGRGLSGAGQPARLHPARHRPGGAPLPRDPDRRAGAAGCHAGRHAGQGAPRRGRLPALRHLRLPAGHHQGPGQRARLQRGRGRLQDRHGGAAPARPQGQEVRPGRLAGDLPRPGPARDRLPGLRLPWPPAATVLNIMRDGVGRQRGPARATPWRSC